MTWFSLTPLVFLTPYVWDGAAHFVRGRVEALGALTERGLRGAKPVDLTDASHPVPEPRSVSARSVRRNAASKVFAALSEGRSSAALLPSGTSATAGADGLRTAAEQVPDFWKAA